MYMNEFDCFVRHTLKPLAYIRYGDDFVLFCGSRSMLDQARTSSIEKLNELGLNINQKQDRVVRCWQGLHFLGHIISCDELAVCSKTRNTTLEKSNLRNIASYASLKINDETKRILPWQVDI
jgi:hypothetical protein